MLVQLAIDNRAGELLPGAFATLRFDLPAAADGVSVPPGALIYGKDGARLATLDQAGRVLLKPVRLGRDLGTVVQIAGGIEPGDRIIDSPPDGIVSGDNVRVAP
jgi:multidrug efflux pump subunit AcrA (membrane-fusion protein)